MESFYDFLGVSPDAPRHEIVQAIGRARAAQLAGAGVRSKSILEAAEQMLLDPKLRAEYDRDLMPRRPSREPVQLTVVEQIPSVPTSSPAPIATTNQSAFQCASCRFSDPVYSGPFCPSCGATVAQGQSGQFGQLVSAAPNASSELTGLERILGFSARANGTVIAVDKFEIDEGVRWGRFLLFGFLFVACGWWILQWVQSHQGLILMVILGMVLLAIFATSLFTFFAGQLVSMISGLKPGKQERRKIAVRDVRVRQENGAEVLVRIQGDLSMGSVSPGDQIEVLGSLRGGMVFFGRGFNRRTRSKIRRKLF